MIKEGEKMKKVFLFIICVIMTLTLVTGCTNNEKDVNTSVNNNQNKQIELKEASRYTESSDSLGIQIDLLKNNEVTLFI